MSWNTAKKRFQFDLARYPEYLRPALRALRPNPSLPTFENDRFVADKDKKTTLEKAGIAPGDLAYVAEGEHKGKVSSVVRYNTENDTYMLADILEKKLTPRSMWSAQQTSFLIEIPKEFPASQIKLAAKDRDEQGKISYVVADEVVHKEKYYDAKYYKWMPRRFVKHHENIEIPWPKPPVEAETDELSTEGEAVFLKTYELQSIARSPLPKGVLAELRNPYSRYKKRTLTEEQARKLNAPAMPLSKEQQAYLAKKAKAPVKKLEPLSEEAQEYIGTRIAEHLAKVDHPALLRHLEVLSLARDPGLARVMDEIEAQKEQAP
ncbi:hypothetical protein METBIDRAFT_35812 [Metschnikowia bicuspidata var. bicuspidata NRRL YB-4993]|uniref:KOW domain-containing protein n=1 Tax=Metschnikowia bicuspidata var. bicuspidata NRRL YB-4993 TaxID=869754 RepID=A0A1A0HKA2_9ASCO|nr:hypothetical protein METBIDRAFT_35812 [Metschnikowia bicuspidata var. bicuspidata NRRL YB-4993]OBA24450.1 hypothetical protein METBIDRAFT_35812 [Metschnikowia bicuspidata var. bicuspidata NRRL YB-4993]